MEDKKIKAGTVVVWLCLVLIAVLLIGIVFITYKYTNEKNNLEDKLNSKDQKISELENKISKVSEVINGEDEKKTNNVSKTKTNTNTTKNFTDDEIKNAIQEYLYIYGIYTGVPSELLDHLGFKDFRIGNSVDNYYKTNIKYSEYKDKMLNYMTEKWFKDNFTRFYKNIDGYLYCFDGGGDGLYFKVKDITLKGDYSDLNYIAKVDEELYEGSYEEENIEFHIENNNGKCVISYCDN